MLGYGSSREAPTLTPCPFNASEYVSEEEKSQDRRPFFLKECLANCLPSITKLVNCSLSETTRKCEFVNQKITWPSASYFLIHKYTLSRDFSYT